MGKEDFKTIAMGRETKLNSTETEWRVKYWG